jgi:hypothetical protein
MFDLCGMRISAAVLSPSVATAVRLALTAFLLNAMITDAFAAAPGAAAGSSGAAGASSGAAGASGGSSGSGGTGTGGGSSGATGAAGASSGSAGTAGGSSGANGGGAGGSGASGGGGGGHAPPSIDGPTTATDPGDASPGVKQATDAAEESIAACREDSENVRCLADALDAYAAALRELSPRLPRRLKSLPDIVSRAARSVRHSKNKPQALAAIRIAIAEIHKTLSLVRADDPVLRQVETRDSAMVAETLRVAGDKLEKAVGL